MKMLFPVHELSVKRESSLFFLYFETAAIVSRLSDGELTRFGHPKSSQNDA